MKLVIVSHYFESHRGGIEIVAGNLARAIAERGHDVSWIATDATVPPAASGSVVPIAIPATNFSERYLSLPLPLPTPKGILRIFRKIRAADAVLVNDMLYPTSIVACLAARRFGKPIVAVGHVGVVPYRSAVLRHSMAAANRLVARPLLVRADRVAFISEVTAGYFARLRWRKSPELIFNGVDTATFHPLRSSELKLVLRDRLGLPAQRPIVLFVGRFVEKKGLHILQRMARQRPAATWVFAGWGPIDPDGWGLPNVKVFRDLRGTTLAPLYQAADLLALPSTGEGFPLVIQEALACGLPVVCSAETSLADPSAQPFLAGVQIDPYNPDATAADFCETVDRSLAKADPRAADQRFRFVAERYSWSAAAGRYIELFEDLLRIPATERCSKMLAHRLQSLAVLRGTQSDAP